MTNKNISNSTIKDAPKNTSGKTINAPAQSAAKKPGTNDNLSELVYIIDRSGSMGGLEGDTIGGFNASLRKQQAVEGEANVSVVLFDHERDVIVDRVNVQDVKPMDESTYQVRGCTALLDAVGYAIKHIKRVQGYMPDGYKAGHVIFTIITDGYENASTDFDYSKIKRMIGAAEEEGWEFIFLGANIDAAAEAGRLGIAADRAVEYLSDSEGTKVAYDAVGDAVVKMRCAPSCAPRMGSEWAASVKADTKKRKRRFF